MAESMKGLHRTHRCTEVSNQNIGETVTVMGWVQKRRNLGSLIFIDLRDRSGLLQVVFDEPQVGSEGFEKAGNLRSEFVVAVTGVVQKRSAAVNESLKTGDIEVIANDIRILSEAETPPFPIEENCQTKEELRLKYRYLDLRRPDLQRNIMMKSKVSMLLRNFMEKEGFLEIETPILMKSTPEGARDYLVPSRVHPGSFYALPQSPQLYKQLLMCSGYDRYFQIARCFRDEDLRADRQPEFTQADMELSFVDVDDVIDVNERLLAYVFKEAIGVDVPLPIPRMTWQEAMDRFGSDKPDTRFGMELVDVSETVAGCGFGVFTGALENGGSVRGINAKGQGSMPRKKIDKLGRHYIVKGVIKNISYNAPIHPVAPAMFFLPDNTGRGGIIFKVKEGTWNIVSEKIKAEVDKVNPNAELILSNMEEVYDTYMKSEKTLCQLLSIVSFICIAIAVFGIFSLVTLSCQQRRKEIAIRKVNGANIGIILNLFFREYLLLLVFSSFFAFPLGYVMMKHWLENYIKQTPIEWWLYAVIFIGMGLVIFLSIIWRVWKAARQNPAEVLKSE